MDIFWPRCPAHHRPPPGLTNAVTEGLNSKIQSIKSAARGFRNFQNFRTRIPSFSSAAHLISTHYESSWS